jgi:tetratricopeptide (TPR) repeat protein
LGGAGPSPAATAGAESASYAPAFGPAPASLAYDEAVLRRHRRHTAGVGPDSATALHPDTLIWRGRRAGYRGDHREAIATFSRGLELYPDEPHLLRHRGHRHITVREFDRAIEDLSRAAAIVRGQPDQVEPDGLPNARNLPTSTLQTNVFYHLGLARYLNGDFAAAVEAWEECLALSRNPDMDCATRFWLVLALRRSGRERDAREVLSHVRADWDVIENERYRELLLIFRGDRRAAPLLKQVRASKSATDLATLGQGLGAWALLNGERARAMESFREAAGASSAAFGAIAAEVELARLGTPFSRP